MHEACFTSSGSGLASCWGLATNQRASPPRIQHRIGCRPKTWRLVCGKGLAFFKIDDDLVVGQKRKKRFHIAIALLAIGVVEVVVQIYFFDRGLLEVLIIIVELCVEIFAHIAEFFAHLFFGLFFAKVAGFPNHPVHTL
jgi:hypothetical protein